MKRILLAFSFLLAACAPGTETALQKALVTVYATPAAGPWLSELYVCANRSSVALAVTPDSPDISLRVGEPEMLDTPAFQIDEEEILVVTNRESPVQNLTLEEARALFAGEGDPSVQVWAYASDEDLQVAFDHFVMQGRIVTTFARLATSPQQMSDLLNSQVNAVGILPRHWKTGTVRQIFSAGRVPVLAITRAEPTGSVRDLIACLQK